MAIQKDKDHTITGLKYCTIKLCFVIILKILYIFWGFFLKIYINFLKKNNNYYIDKL